MNSLQEVNDFITASNLKNSEDLAEIFKELVVKYPEESERQHAIRGMIMLFERKYPAEMKEHTKAIQVAKEQLSNEFGSDKDMSMRLTFRLPQGLMTRINMVIKEPAFLSEEAAGKFDELEWFSKEFPRYFVPAAL